MSASDFDIREFRNTLGRFATGVTVITTAGATSDNKPEGLTANSFTALSLQPALILWCLAKDSPNLQAFQHCTTFAINILRSNQRHLSHQFATPAEDKFKGVEWSQGLGGAPLLADSLATLECHNHAYHDGGDHLIFIGQVENFHYNEGQPLLFNAGRYGIAAEHPDNCGKVDDADDFKDLLL